MEVENFDCAFVNIFKEDGVGHYPYIYLFVKLSSHWIKFQYFFCLGGGYLQGFFSKSHHPWCYEMNRSITWTNFCACFHVYDFVVSLVLSIDTPVHNSEKIEISRWFLNIPRLGLLLTSSLLWLAMCLDLLFLQLLPTMIEIVVVKKKIIL